MLNLGPALMEQLAALKTHHRCIVQIDIVVVNRILRLANHTNNRECLVAKGERLANRGIGAEQVDSELLAHHCGAVVGHTVKKLPGAHLDAGNRCKIRRRRQNDIIAHCLTTGF